MDIKLINEDSLDYMKRLKENTFDAVITDPPYGLTHLNAVFTDMSETPSSGGAFKGSQGAGMAFKASQNRETAAFLRPFFCEAFRVLKPGAFCITFSQGRLLLGVLLALEEAGFEIREQFYWKKPSGLPNQQVACKRNSKIQLDTDRLILGPGKVVEPFVVAQKPRQGSYAQNFQQWGVGLVDPRLATTTLFECPSASSLEKDKLTHPTIKPLQLMRRIVRAFSKDGDLILDPFSGSGTTGIAAYLEGRRCIGVERSELFYKESLIRLEKVLGNIADH